MGREEGQIVEDFFTLCMEKEGLKCDYKNDWYDFLVEGVKVEVKGARPSIKDGNSYGYRIGRFDFTDTENRRKQWDNNVWIAFIIRHEKQCILYGFCKAEAINGMRYVSIHGARKLGLLNLEEWKKIIIPSSEPVS